MKNNIRILLPAILVLAVLGVSAPAVSANHAGTLAFYVSPDPAHRINLLAHCGSDLSYPANTLFFVRHGWLFADWRESSAAEQRGFMSEATRFTLLIDGVLQIQSREYLYLNDPDFMIKLFNTDNHKGLTGSHFFTGRFFLDASIFTIGGSFGEPVLFFECNVVVTFTG